jgi:diguanylate cyclase (GGDEF)-like protein
MVFRCRYLFAAAIKAIPKSGSALAAHDLHRAAAAWRIEIRQSDFIGRYGGEEFIVILPDCPPAGASDVVERLRTVTPDGQTVSGGIATWDGSESAESLLARADRALHSAKHTGRDRLVAACE